MRPSPLPQHLRSDAFSVREARLAGVPPSRLRRSDLVGPTHGVRTVLPAAHDDTAGRCRELLPAIPAAAIFSHVTAARLHGLPVPFRHEVGPLHLAVPRPMRAPRRRGLIAHQLDVVDQHWLGGLPVPDPVEAWVQLGALLAIDDLVVAGDALVRRKGTLADVADLAAAVEAAAGRPGIRRLRLALGQIRPRTDSPMETVLRLAIAKAGLPEPRVNHVIHAAARSYHADLAYPEARLVIEYDGDHHRTDAAQFRSDMDRVWEIEDAGWRVLRLNHSHLAADGSHAVDRIRAALRASRHDAPSSARL